MSKTTSVPGAIFCKVRWNHSGGGFMPFCLQANWPQTWRKAQPGETGLERGFPSKRVPHDEQWAEGGLAADLRAFLQFIKGTAEK